jgi:hypothetical protein
MTVLKYAQDTLGLAHVDSNARADNDTVEPTSTYTNLDILGRDFENGIPDAITYMHGLMDYSDECEHEDREWEE